MEENKIYVSEPEYAKLCRVDGKMDAIIDYVRTTDYLDKKVVMAIIGIDYFTD